MALRTFSVPLTAGSSKSRYGSDSGFDSIRSRRRIGEGRGGEGGIKKMGEAECIS